MIPVVYIHQGNQPYLRTALEQAKRWNPEVVLLGIGNKGMWSPWYPWISKRMIGFQAVYQHMNTNPEPFELACFYRWFALHDWMTEQGVDRVFYCDTDVMLYCNVTEWAESVGNPDVSFQIPQHQPEYRWSASAHVSLWTRDALGAFCDFIMWLYTEDIGHLQQKWAWHQETRTPGGVCDMALLWRWAIGDLLARRLALVNNAQVINGATFDHNINVAENYELDEYAMWPEGTKKSSFKESWADNRPALLKLDEASRESGNLIHGSGEIVFANALHFQGQNAKALMEGYKT